MQNPWINMPISEPYVLAEDEQIILAYNQSLEEKYSENHEIHLEVFPEPYAGNPQASVILLNLNPGYYPRSKVFGQGTADFRRLWRANLAHEPQDYPFYHLDPRMKGTPGDAYWSAKLREPIDEFGSRRVAETFFTAEYFPYSTKHGIGPIRVPSQEYTFSLIREAIRRGAIIVRTRCTWWLEVIPGLTGYLRYYELRSMQNAAITEKNCPGYHEIRKVLGD